MPGRRELLLAASAVSVVLPSVVLPSAVFVQAPAGAPSLPAAAPMPPSAAMAFRAVESVREPILRISREVWANAERSFAEEKSAAIHVRELQAAAFA